METEQSTASATPQESVAAAPNAEAATTTETPPSEGQTATTAAVESPKPEAVDYRALYEKDPALKQFVEGRAGDISKKLTAKLERQFEKQRLAKAVDEPVEALTYVQERKSAMDAEDSAEAGLTAKWAAVKASVEATAKEDPSWGEDYQAVVDANRREADTLYGASPEKFEKWVDKQIYQLHLKREVDKAIKERLPTLVEAAATDKVNKAMGNYPQMPIGNGGAGISDKDYLAAYAEGKVDDHKRAREALARLK